MTVYIGYTPIEPIVVPRQFFMVEPQDMKYRGVKVPNGCGIHGCSPAEVIRCTVTNTSFDSGAHHPTSESIRIVIAACRAVLVGRHATEFRGPQD